MLDSIFIELFYEIIMRRLNAFSSSSIKNKHSTHTLRKVRINFLVTEKKDTFIMIYLIIDK